MCICALLQHAIKALINYIINLMLFCLIVHVSALGIREI